MLQVTSLDDAAAAAAFISVADAAAVAATTAAASGEKMVIMVLNGRRANLLSPLKNSEKKIIFYLINEFLVKVNSKAKV